MHAGPSTSSSAPTTRTAIRELIGSKELLRNLTVRELKVRYKRSALGFLWTLLNPLMMMAVFTAIFSTVFKSSIDHFWLYFLTGYLPFAFFQASSQVATGSVIGNANLVTKVYFSRAVLPLSVVLSQLVHLGMGLGVLLVAEAATGRLGQVVTHLHITLLGIVLLAMFTAGFSMLLAAANAFVRDIQEFTTVAFLLWFYATPIIYPMTAGPTNPIPETVLNIVKLNPLSQYVGIFRAGLYDFTAPGLTTTLAATASSVVMLVIGWTVFNRLAPRFAKEV